MLIDSLVNVIVQQVSVGDNFSMALCSHKVTTAAACRLSHAGQFMTEKDSAICLLCKQDFNWSRRPHNCRNCGGLFCNNCSLHRVTLLRFGYTKPVRVCDNCNRLLAKTGGGAPGESPSGSNTFRSMHSDESSDATTAGATCEERERVSSV